MHDFKKIEYVDATYILESEKLSDFDLEDLKLPKLTIFGTLSFTDEGDVIIESIRELNINNEKEKVINLGLVIPKNNILENYQSYNFDTKNLTLDSKIKILWKDVVAISNKPPTKCSLMEIEGHVKKVNDKFLILSNPKNKRLSPEPQKQHPEEKVQFYIIPYTQIIKYEIL
jgi:hypothetical protein